MAFWNRDPQTAAQPSVSDASVTPSAPQVITFRSADGTTIGCYRSGAGPAIVAIHGAAADHSAWDFVAPQLARHFTVYVMDRRGRGVSGDAPEYSLEREFEDVVAVVEGIGQPVHLYGHSFGGTCAIEAAMRTPHVASLMLYEGGPKPPGLRFIPDELISHLDTLIAQGQREEALSLFMRTAAGLTPSELEALRRSPAWAARVAAAHTIPRELRALNDYGTDLSRFSALTAPTLLLLGGQTEARRREMFVRLSGIIPRGQIHELPGQGHAANTTAPELFAGILTEFLLDVTR